MILGFIPARGASKRIPRKNVRMLGDRPLIQWTISCARESGRLSEIVVSSEDPEILEIGKKGGVIVDQRPPELAVDLAKSTEVLAEYLKRPENKDRFTHVMLLPPTCPFRSVDDIHAALTLHEKSPDCFIVSISEYEFPPDFACGYDPDSHMLSTNRPAVYARSTQSQSVPKSWHPNGAIYLGPINRFLDRRSFFIDPVLGLPMPAERSLDLDHEWQWIVAEAFAAAAAASGARRTEAGI